MVKANAARQAININQSNPIFDANLDELFSDEVDGLDLRFSKDITLPKMSSPRFSFIFLSNPGPVR